MRSGKKNNVVPSFYSYFACERVNPIGRTLEERTVSCRL